MQINQAISPMAAFYGYKTAIIKHNCDKIICAKILDYQAINNK
jgi:hypothetical protein